MMIARLWRLARGQVRVRVTGASLPRFLNLCAEHGLMLRGMERTAWNELYATLSLQDFRALLCGAAFYCWRHCAG